MSQATPQALPARSERAERKRQRILDAAAHCFAASGFSKATVEEIAGAAGVSKALVYHHFRGKEAIFEELLERTLTEWAQVSEIETPNASVGFDLIVLRPFGLLATGVGAALAVPAVALTALTHPQDIHKPIEFLVMRPARYTFGDPIGTH